jgi:hypothetical protein
MVGGLVGVAAGDSVAVLVDLDVVDPLDVRGAAPARQATSGVSVVAFR